MRYIQLPPSHNYSTSAITYFGQIVYAIYSTVVLTYFGQIVYALYSTSALTYSTSAITYSRQTVYAIYSTIVLTYFGKSCMHYIEHLLSHISGKLCMQYIRRLFSRIPGFAFTEIERTVNNVHKLWNIYYSLALNDVRFY